MQTLNRRQTSRVRRSNGIVDAFERILESTSGGMVLKDIVERKGKRRIVEKEMKREMKWQQMTMKITIF